MTNDKLRRAQLVAYLRNHPESTVGEIAAHVELSDRQVRRLLTSVARGGELRRRARFENDGRQAANLYEFGEGDEPAGWPEASCY